jgi:hypothetical protein
MDIETRRYRVRRSEPDRIEDAIHIDEEKRTAIVAGAISHGIRCATETGSRPGPRRSG